AGNLVTWWTGDALMVFESSSLTLRYTIAAGAATAPLGPATMMAGRLLVPVTGAIGVYDPVNGNNERYIPVNRPPGAPARRAVALRAGPSWFRSLQVPGCSSSAATRWRRWAEAPALHLYGERRQRLARLPMLDQRLRQL